MAPGIATDLAEFNSIAFLGYNQRFGRLFRRCFRRRLERRLERRLWKSFRRRIRKRIKRLLWRRFSWTLSTTGLIVGVAHRDRLLELLVGVHNVHRWTEWRVTEWKNKIGEQNGREHRTGFPKRRPLININLRSSSVWTSYYEVCVSIAGIVRLNPLFVVLCRCLGRTLAVTPCPHSSRGAFLGESWSS